MRPSVALVVLGFAFFTAHAWADPHRNTDGDVDDRLVGGERTVTSGAASSGTFEMPRAALTSTTAKPKIRVQSIRMSTIRPTTATGQVGSNQTPKAVSMGGNGAPKIDVEKLMAALKGAPPIEPIKSTDFGATNAAVKATVDGVVAAAKTAEAPKSLDLKTAEIKNDFKAPPFTPAKTSEGGGAGAGAGAGAGGGAQGAGQQEAQQAQAQQQQKNQPPIVVFENGRSRDAQNLASRTGGTLNSDGTVTIAGVGTVRPFGDGSAILTKPDGTTQLFATQAEVFAAITAANVNINAKAAK